MGDVTCPKTWSFARILSEHVYDKLVELDMTYAEFERLLDYDAEVIEVTEPAPGTTKALVLNLHWTRPLHVVVAVDEFHREDRLVTVYIPTPDRWSADYRRRR
jgi:hypothetical protein